LESDRPFILSLLNHPGLLFLHQNTEFIRILLSSFPQDEEILSTVLLQAPDAFLKIVPPHTLLKNKPACFFYLPKETQTAILNDLEERKLILQALLNSLPFAASFLKNVEYLDYLSPEEMRTVLNRKIFDHFYEPEKTFILNHIARRFSHDKE